MIAFFCNIAKNSKKPPKITFVEYESFTKDVSNTENAVYLLKDKCCQVYQLNNLILYNVGTIIINDKCGRDALSDIANKITSGQKLENVMRNTHGQFCLLIILNKQIYVITDKTASFPVYKYENGDSIQISTLFLPLIRRNTLSLNPQSLAEYLTFNFSFKPLFKEVELLDYGSIYSLAPSINKKVYYNYLNNLCFERYSSLEEATEAAIDVMEKNLSFLGENMRIFSDLTGGFDSRLINAFLSRTGLSFSAGICGEQVKNEINIAKRVSRILDVPFVSNVRITSKDIFRSMLSKHYEISNGIPIPFHSTELINFYTGIKQDYDLHIAGFATTTIPKLSLFSSRLKPNNIIKKRYRMLNLVKSEVLDESTYYKNLSSEFSRIFNTIGTDKHERVVDYFHSVTTTKHYHGSLLGTHNAIMPIYNPLLEADFIRTIIETPFRFKQNRLLHGSIISTLNRDLSSEMTSHGFNANVESIIAASKLKNAKNFSRRILYDLPFLYFVNKRIAILRKKLGNQAPLPEIDRSFWINELYEEWNDDMIILDYIDKSSLNNLLKTHHDKNHLKAKILYVNRILSESLSKIDFDSSLLMTPLERL